MPTIRRSELALLLQAILIALPVAVLAGSALHLLRNDRAEVEQQARDNARVIAPELARQLGWQASAELARPEYPHSQGEIVDGQVKLPGFAQLPEPDDWPRKLTVQQAQWWKMAQDATYRKPDSATARKALSALAASARPDGELRGNAELGLLEQADWSGQSVNPSERAVELAQRFPLAVTPAGTPVAALALLLALRHTAVGALPDHLMREVETNTMDHASFLTPELLQAARRAAGGGMYAIRVATLQQHGKGEEAAREKTREALRSLLGRPIPTDRPSEIWLGEELACISPKPPANVAQTLMPAASRFVSTPVRPGATASEVSVRMSACATSFDPNTCETCGLGEDSQSVLALTNPVHGGWYITLVPAASLVAALQKTLRSMGGLPEYAGALVEIGGERRRVTGAATRDADPPVLASAGGVLTLGTEHAFTLRLDLSNPAPLYAHYQQRRRLIQGLIVSAATTAFIGLAALWAGHRRQARLNEMKSNFVSSVSHELRAPIAAVQLMAESLESGRVTGESRQQDYYRLIVQECRRLSTLVGNVLDFARIDQGRQSYRFEPVDAMALLRHSVMLMQPHAEQQHVRLTLSEPLEGMNDCQPSWDGEAVEQSLVNLLDNAIKHSSEGTEVRVEMECRGDAVRLWVRDCGPGIPQADHARIFDRFYRRGQELRRETKGVGIGLSIVKHVAEGHGGRVLVESVVGQGSSFGLELPQNPGSHAGDRS